MIAAYILGFIIGFVGGAAFAALIRLGKTVDNRLRQHPDTDWVACPWPMAGTATRIRADNNTGSGSFKHKSHPVFSVGGSEEAHQ